MRGHARSTSFIALTGALAALGCGLPTEGAPRTDEAVSMAEFGLHGRSYADTIPADHQTRISRADAGSDSTQIPSGGATAVVDATGERTYFPMPRETRNFANQAELAAFIVAHFGATELFHDEQTGDLIGARGSYAQYGRAVFEDTEIGAQFRVTAPVLAFVGGVQGLVNVGGEGWCVDTDGDCSEARASYLEPIGVTTKPTHKTRCGTSSVCVQFHTFYNRTWFPAPWARHGSNVIFTSNHAVPSTELLVSGFISAPPGTIDPLFWFNAAMPLISNQGQDSIETAVWCFGTTSCVEYQATAACGDGAIDDVALNAREKTGNGPANTQRCGT